MEHCNHRYEFNIVMSSPHHCSDQFDMKNLTKTEILTQIHHTSIIINHVSQRFVHCRLHIFYYHCLKYIIITSVFLPVSRSLSEINPIWWKLCSFGDVVVITMSSTSLRPQLSAALSVDPIMTAGKNFYLGCWENKKQFYTVKKIHFFYLFISICVFWTEENWGGFYIPPNIPIFSTFEYLMHNK